MYHEIFLLDNFNHGCLLGCSVLCDVTLGVFGCMRCSFKSAENRRVREGGMNVSLSGFLAVLLYQEILELCIGLCTAKSWVP